MNSEPTETLRDLAEYLEAHIGDRLSGIEWFGDELVLRVEAGALLAVVGFLQDDGQCRFRTLVDLCGVDFPERPRRFDVVYNLLSIEHNTRVRLKVATDEDTPVPSVTTLFRSAEWNERETWDMYGIFFADHPDLRRLLTDYGFEGHPLRKDFPLTGHVEVRYDDQQKRVIYEPVQLTQDFRDFDFLSPWEGVQATLADNRKTTDDDPAASD